ncbi:MAG: hypothetical protein COZ12_05795 [Deltaproteobacteria bacterium CG_4_10_14_3_um_filter_60_8]|nr:MAG: hypothetical protein COZ12_05795 [Deltaproteobacteria bacterium CG_4_10_14_3_um_filter_60_8]
MIPQQTIQVLVFAMIMGHMANAADFLAAVPASGADFIHATGDAAGGIVTEVMRAAFDTSAQAVRHYHGSAANDHCRGQCDYKRLFHLLSSVVHSYCCEARPTIDTNPALPTVQLRT